MRLLMAHPLAGVLAPVARLGRMASRQHLHRGRLPIREHALRRRRLSLGTRPQTLAGSGVYQFAYTLDGSGNVTQTSIADPNGNVRQVAFNSSGYATSTTWASGKPEAQTFTYSRGAGTNLLLSSADALSRTTSYTYDSMGNVGFAIGSHH